MKFMFRNEAFSFETLRAAGFAVYGGADLGEVIVTAQKVRGNDVASWHRSWKATAERVHKIGPFGAFNAVPLGVSAAAAASPPGRRDGVGEIHGVSCPLSGARVRQRLLAGRT